MAFDLQSLLVRFLQLYRLDREGLERLLMLEADDLEKKDPGAVAWDQAAAEALRSRALIDSTELAERVSHLVSLFPDLPEPRPRSEDFLRFVFRGADLDRVAELLGSDLRGEEFEKWYFQHIREVLEQERQVKRLAARQPDFAAYFAWDFALRLNSLVSRTQSLADLEYKDIISGNLRILFQEAHRCYLDGFEFSVAVICGAILEQALKQTLNVDWNLDLMLKEAEDRGMLTPEEWGMADTVREARNCAVHDLSKFLRPEIRKATLLSNTRNVVKKLLAARSQTRFEESRP
ncbi:MAG: DUF4145 domain-containing protein [Acidobacteriaceae bacterium]